MNREFFMENRKALYSKTEEKGLLLLFSGHAPKKTNDENYPFFADRSYMYFTGVHQEDTILMTEIYTKEEWKEALYILPPDMLAERWTGRRIKPEEAEAQSGIQEYRNTENFQKDLENCLMNKGFTTVYMDFGKLEASEADTESYRLAAWLRKEYPYVQIKNLNPWIRQLRTIKKPCELEALRKAEWVTKEGIEAMMRASKPGMFEYQYKAEFDYALAQHGILAPGFPSIISAGQNNFCIHYYSYRGQAQD